MSQEQRTTVSLVERLTVNGLVGLVGVIIFWDAASLEGASAIFPRTIGGALLVLSVVSAGIAVYSRAAFTTAEADFGRGLAGLLLMLGYIWSSGMIGFLTSALWFLPALAFLGGERRIWHIAALTIGFGLLVFAIFGLIFEQPLPPELILGEL